MKQKLNQVFFILMIIFDCLLVKAICKDIVSYSIEANDYPAPRKNISNKL